MADDIGGVWRTIGGRRVFIKTGQSLSQAMKASGKFKRLKKKEEDSDPRSAVAYFLKKGEFEKAEKYLKDYGLEDEREEFADALNYEAQKDYKEYLSKAKDKEEAQTIQSVSKLVQMEMNDTGDESVDQFVNRLVGKSAKSVEAKRTELNKRLEHASEEYSKYAKSLSYTEKFRDEFEYWSREKKLYAELVYNYDKLHKKKTKATNAPLF